MDTDAQLTERDPSPAPDQGPEQGSRFARFRARAAGLRHRPVTLLALCLAFVLLLSTFIAQPFLIPSSSMENTLRIGDRVLVNKLAYRFGSPPARGDVVVFDGTGSFVHREQGENPVTGLLRGAGAALGLARPAETDYVKRVIGIGGDHVTCCDKRGRIKVNGEPVSEAYLHPGDAPSSVDFDIVVPDGRLWVMGDHRARSSDSRDHLGQPGGGTVPVDKVIGRADLITWPMSRWRTFDAPGTFDRIPAAAGPHG